VRISQEHRSTGKKSGDLPVNSIGRAREVCQCDALEKALAREPNKLQEVASSKTCFKPTFSEWKG